MMQLNPKHRPSAEEIIEKIIPKADFTKTMVKSNSGPSLLQTIKVPNDMSKLKKLLPDKKYPGQQRSVVNKDVLPVMKQEAQIQRPSSRITRSPS